MICQNDAQEWSLILLQKQHDRKDKQEIQDCRVVVSMFFNISIDISWWPFQPIIVFGLPTQNPGIIQAYTQIKIQFKHGCNFYFFFLTIWFVIEIHLPAGEKVNHSYIIAPEFCYPMIFSRSIHRKCVYRKCIIKQRFSADAARS